LLYGSGFYAGFADAVTAYEGFLKPSAGFEPARFAEVTA
jgi:hypothetical protein